MNTRAARLAVFVSGGGSNLQALLDRFAPGAEAAAQVAAVIASRPSIGAIARAERAGVPVHVLDEREMGAREVEADHLAERMLAVLAEHEVDLVVLAGYLQLLPAAVVRAYSGRVLNIHPALLPAFGGRGMYGLRVHRAVLAAGACVSGATVHWVDEEYDRGQIVAQWPVPVLADDTPESLAARVLAVEHLLLPATIEAVVGAVVPEAPVVAESFSLVTGRAPCEAGIRQLLGEARVHRVLAEPLTT